MKSCKPNEKTKEKTSNSWHHGTQNFTIHTVFPHIVSVETILFWIFPYVLWPLITVHKCAETIQGRKLFKGGNYMRKYGNTNIGPLIYNLFHFRPKKWNRLSATLTRIYVKDKKMRDWRLSLLGLIPTNLW